MSITGAHVAAGANERGSGAASWMEVSWADAELPPAAAAGCRRKDQPPPIRPPHSHTADHSTLARSKKENRLATRDGDSLIVPTSYLSLSG